MPKDTSIKKVLVIGSGPIVIGQAAEFDYAGTQACRVLKQEGVETVLVNSNPATIMTDSAMADAVYLEPLTSETIKRIILETKPDSLLAGLGGQTGLTIAMELAHEGFLREHNVRLIGTNADAIDKAEDRQLFKDAMARIGQPTIPSDTAHDIETCVAIAEPHRLPCHRAACLHPGRRRRRRGLQRGRAAGGRLPLAWTTPPSHRSWSKSISSAGKRSSLRSCATHKGNGHHRSAPWRTLTPWASTPATPSSWPLR